MREILRRRYGLDVDEKSGADETARKALKKRRADALRICRVDLVREKAGTYAEQFQGMYAMMRGLLAASVVGGSFYLGWLAPHVVPPFRSFVTGHVSMGAWAVVVAAVLSSILLVLVNRRSGKTLWLVAILMLPLGVFPGSTWPVEPNHASLLLVALVVLVALGATSRVAFRRFTHLFADETFRSFYELALAEGWHDESAKARIRHVSFADDTLSVDLTDGRSIAVLPLLRRGPRQARIPGAASTSEAVGSLDDSPILTFEC